MSAAAADFTSPNFADGASLLAIDSAASGTILGGDGADIFLTMGADVTVDAGAGNDAIYAAGLNTTVDGGDGDDTVYLIDPAVGSLTFDGGAGTDTVSFEKSPFAVDLNLAGGSNLTLSSVEQVIGSNNGDHFVLGNTPTIVFAGSGSNVFDADADGSGSTAIVLGSGNDAIHSTVTDESSGVALYVGQLSTGHAVVDNINLPAGTDQNLTSATVDVDGIVAVHAESYDISSAALSFISQGTYGASGHVEYGMEKPDEEYVITGSADYQYYIGQVILQVGSETIDLGTGFERVTSNAQGTFFQGLVPLQDGSYITPEGEDASQMTSPFGAPVTEYASWMDTIRIYFQDGAHSLTDIASSGS